MRRALPVLNPGFAVDIHREDGTYCFGINTRIDGFEFGLLDGRGHVDLDVDALQLPAGCYLISAGIHRAGGIGSAGGIGTYDVHELALSLHRHLGQDDARGDVSGTRLAPRRRHHSDRRACRQPAEFQRQRPSGGGDRSYCEGDHGFMIADNVRLGANVFIPQPQLVNLYGCAVGDGSKIGAFVEIQRGASVGRNCKISSAHASSAKA